MMRKISNEEIIRAATLVFCKACMGSSSSNFIVDVDEIEKYLCTEIDKQTYIKICNALRREFREQVLDVNDDNDDYAWEQKVFDVIIGIDYTIYADFYQLDVEIPEELKEEE